MMFTSGDCAGQVRCWSSPPCSSNSSICVNGGIVVMEKLHRCSEITSGSWDAPHYPTCPRTPFTHEWDQQNTVPRYCCPNHQRTSPVFRCWNQAFRIVGFHGCSPNVNSSWCREKHEGRLMWRYHSRISSCLMCSFCDRDTIVCASEHYF
jgi:hypothetical protein